MSAAAALLLLLGISGLVALLWWLLITTEGVYLGPRVVIALYDLYARRYDAIKGLHSEYEHWYLAHPLMQRLTPQLNPMVLDIATGTGRLPLALCNHESFQGHVVGIDRSERMLTEAACKLNWDMARGRVELLVGDATALPFDDACFDVVCCLEALEFMSDAASALREGLRVLRPGGLLLITNRVGRHWMPGKTWSEARLRALLTELGAQDIHFEVWQVDYIKVWSQKYGTSAPLGPRPVIELIRPETPVVTLSAPSAPLDRSRPEPPSPP